MKLILPVLCNFRRQFLTNHIKFRNVSAFSAGHILEKSAINRPIQYQLWPQLRHLSQSTEQHKKSDQNKKHDDGIEYIIEFKRGLRVKDFLKQIYSLYGPVFVACHIAVSLTSLGLFYSLVLMSVDLTEYMSTYLTLKVGQSLIEATEKGGKFIVAYAVHKALLPVRLFVSLALTRYISRFIKYKK